MHPAGPCPSAFVWHQITQCLEATIALTPFASLFPRAPCHLPPQAPQHLGLVIQNPKQQQQLWALGNSQASHCSPSPILFATSSMPEVLTGHCECYCGWLFPNEKPVGRQILANWGRMCLTLIS